MKKDYTVIRENTPAEEIAFVEEFWTERWDSRECAPDPGWVARSEEYKIMASFLKSIPAGSRILDGGCGLGDWTVFLTDQGFQVVGLDVSQRTIARLQEIFPNYQFIQGDIRATGFPAASFDAYFSWGTFEHFENGPGDCLKEAYRLLKPGGLLFISVPYQNWRHILREASPRYRWHEAFNLKLGSPCPLRFYQWRFTRADLRQELERQGLMILKMKPIHSPEGARRTLVWDFRLKEGTRVFAAAEMLLCRLIPPSLLSHMLMAVARKTDHGDSQRPDDHCQ